MTSLHSQPTVVLQVGAFAVLRRSIRGSLYNSYSVMDGATPVWTIMSYPSEAECAVAIRLHRVPSPAPAKKRGRPAGRVINGPVRPMRAAA